MVIALGLLLLATPTVTDGEEITVSLDRPDPFSAAFGEVTIEAVVVGSEPIERVVFSVDGVVVGELLEPPWTLTVQLGADPTAHRFDVVAHGRSGATGSGGLHTPELRIDDSLDIALQQLFVTVTRGRDRVLDLGPESFAVIDDGQRQELVTFARGDIPFSAVVLVDSSTSMRGEKLDAALAGARVFFDGMRTLDEGKLLVFSDRVLHTTPFTTSPETLGIGLTSIEAKGGTALNDHLFLALRQLLDRQGRRVVILLSDGVDSHSVLDMADVARAARRNQALVYWLRLPYRAGRPADEMPSLTTAWRGVEDYRREIDSLARTVRESGGSVRPLASIEEISVAFRGILEELRQQYVLGYYPTGKRHDGSWRRVRVRADRPGVEIRCRAGYLDD